MIVRDRPSGLTLFLVLRGSILTRIWKVLLVNIAVALVVTGAHGTLFDHKVTLTPIPFTLIGLAFAIFLGFRNNTAYDRFWEGRKLWGRLVASSRNLARQCLCLIDGTLPASPDRSMDVRTRMIHRTIAFSHALRQHLRGKDDAATLRDLLDAGEWRQYRSAANPPGFLLLRTGNDLHHCLKAGLIDGCRAAAIDQSLSEMTAAMTGCERIKNTPIPFSYTLLLHRTAYLYCFLLPFGLVDTIGFMTPVVVAIVAYTFFGLDALGDEIEEPFGDSPNDLPLEAICRAIEIDLREALGESNLPPAMEPVDYLLM